MTTEKIEELSPLQKYFKKIQKPAEEYCQENKIVDENKELYIRGFHQGYVEGKLAILKIVIEELKKENPNVSNVIKEHYTNNTDLKIGEK
ncbi:MAG: hypothetical protein H6Q15_2087 [Bacteroidetes bacterium]|nr:hypothetical protein [Bacteroidota bacterium]